MVANSTAIDLDSTFQRGSFLSNCPWSETFRNKNCPVPDLSFIHSCKRNFLDSTLDLRSWILKNFVYRAANFLYTVTISQKETQEFQTILCYTQRYSLCLSCFRLVNFDHFGKRSYLSRYFLEFVQYLLSYCSMLRFKSD